MPLLTRRQVLRGAFATGLVASVPAGLWAQAGPQASASPPSRPGIRRVVIDTDPGNDDALALLLGLRTPSLRVEAVTVCPGNLGPDYAQQVQNALYLVELAGRAGRVPVFAGMARPLLDQPYPVATFIHGRYGLGSVQAPPVAQRPEAEHAVDALRRLVKAAPGEITLLALGGLTNIAMAMLRDPAFTRALQGILFVGGRYASPGLPPSYNVLVDPEAAHVVFTSGVPLTLVGADAIRRDSLLEDADFARIATFNTPLSRFFLASNELRRTFEKANRGTTGSTNPDSLAVAIAGTPAVAQRYEPIFAQVELQGALTRGLLVYGNDIYRGRPAPAPNAQICVQADAAAFKQLVFATLSAA